MSIESKAHAFIEEKQADIAQDDSLYSALFGATLQTSSYGTITKDKDRYIQIGKCEAAIAPDAGAEALVEGDAELTLICLSRVKNSRTDKDNYAIARDDVKEMGKALGLLFFNNSDVEGAVFDSLPTSLLSDFCDIGGEPFAVSNVKIKITEIGQQLEG